MRTYTVTLTGETKAAEVVATLVRRSQWFTFEPLPDDQYEVTVKAELKSWIDELVS